MANGLVCVFLLLFAGAVRSNREPFNVSYPPLKKSFVFESPTGPLNSVRPANASRTPVARLNIPVFPDIMRCDLKGGFPNKKMILGDFIMLTHDEQLWFFYHEFVVQMSLPVLSRLFEDEVDEQRNLDFMLEHDFPFRYRKSLTKDPQGDYSIVAVSEFDKVMPFYTGSGEIFWSPKHNWDTETRLFLDPVEGLGLKNSKLFVVDWSQNYRFGKLVEKSLYNNMQRRPHEFTVLRYDTQKWLEIIYTTPRTVTFQIYDFSKGAYCWPAIRNQLYETKAAVYYELKDDHWESDDSYGWSGYMVEADTVGGIHFHHYTFKWSRISSKKTLAIDQHFHYEMPILDFFNCRVKGFYPLRRVHQLKGIIIGVPIKGEEAAGYVTYVFIDVFYFAFAGDLLANGLNLYDPELQKWAFELEFEGAKPPPIRMDRYSTKYVKSLWIDNEWKPLFTFHPTKTYELSDASKNDRFWFKESNQRAHLCPHSILQLRKQPWLIICVHKQYYQFLSFFGYEDFGEYKNSRRYPLSDLFENSTVNYSPDTHIEYVFNYQEDTVVFVTYHWLLVFKTEAFQVILYRPAIDEILHLELTSRNLTLPIYYRRSNCLWTRCEPNHSHLDDDPLAPIDLFPDNEQ